jgi:putative tricarboxylic transport membrane protein
VILRRDHVAGGVFVVVGVLVLAVSQDLPFGRLASPGAGMLPVVVTSLMILFGLAILLRAGSSPPMAQISWGDFPHAVRVTAVAAAAAALYTTLGFVLTMVLMLFVLIYAIERRPLPAALAIAIPVPIVIYLVFEHALKTPLERGLLWWF